MIVAILVSLIVFAIVGSYMAIVNRMLRSDEQWSEPNMVKPAAKAAAPLHYGARHSEAHA
ncbi:MAG TPA: hypothetical protein VNT99_00810 [Methylomirabilota bacterium]|nr:hypothetical protein [Methylomirabilota bacterium]